MARKLYVLAILLLAGSIGVLGFQSLRYLDDGLWPSVSVAFVWDSLFGPTPWATNWLPLGQFWHWIGGWPITVAGICAAYLAFLASDILRVRG
jgi:hypothetical protein